MLFTMYRGGKIMDVYGLGGLPEEGFHLEVIRISGLSIHHNV